MIDLKKYIRYLKYKYELKNARKDNKLETERDLSDYFFGEEVQEVRNKYKDIEHNRRAYIKNARNVNRVAAGTLATLTVLSFLVGSNLASLEDKEKPVVDTTTPAEVITNKPAEPTQDYASEITQPEEEYGYKLTTEQILRLADKSLGKISKILMSTGATPMSTSGNEFYPEWFNKEMITSITLMESSGRATNADGSPLYGYGTTQRARGMCQLLPSTVDQINYWLHNTMESDLSYTYEDCDNPEKSVEMCILLCIMNTKNFFRPGKDIYQALDLRNNETIQMQCVVGSYNYGPGNIMRAYNEGKLFDTYLNLDDWIDGDGVNYVKKFMENYNTLTYQKTME